MYTKKLVIISMLMYLLDSVCAGPVTFAACVTACIVGNPINAPLCPIYVCGWASGPWCP